MPEEVAGDIEGTSPLSYSNEANVSQKLQPLMAQLKELKSDDRRKLLKEFGMTTSNNSSSVAPQRKQVFEASFWQGATPPAAELERIEKVLPGGAERLIAMAERQQNHRFTLETKVVTAQLNQSQLGQIFALVIGLAGLGCAGYVASLGHPTASASIAGVALGSLAIAFIIGKAQEKHSRENKR